MERVQLRAARARKEWSLEQAAEHIGVGRNSLWRWECGQATPHSYNRQRLCKVYGMTAAELDLERSYSREEAQPTSVHLTHKHDENIDTSIDVFTNSLQHDLEVRLQYLIYDWIHRKKPAWSLAKLQDRLEQDLESYDQMKNPNYQNHTEVDLGRRNALRQLVLVAIQAVGVAALGTRLAWAPEDILTHCAAGITACAYLAKGQREDMALAFSAICTYLPELEAIAKDSSVHRGEATRLVAQCYLLKHVLGLHIENPNVVVARGYAKLAFAYSKESGDPLLQLTALKYLTWAYNSDKQYPLALKTIERAQYLIEHGSNSLPPRVCSGIYSTLAVIQAKNGVSAVPSLHLAQESFFALPVKDTAPIHHIDLDLGYAQLMRNNGLTYYYAGQYQQALNAFAQVIDPNDLSPKVPMAVRTRVEILTNQTMAALKSPTRDMEQIITYWTASMQGAIALQSQQRFDESCLAYEVMAGIWSGDQRITALRDLTRHW